MSCIRKPASRRISSLLAILLMLLVTAGCTAPPEQWLIPTPVPTTAITPTITPIATVEESQESDSASETVDETEGVTEDGTEDIPEDIPEDVPEDASSDETLDEAFATSTDVFTDTARAESAGDRPARADADPRREQAVQPETQAEQAAPDLPQPPPPTGAPSTADASELHSDLASALRFAPATSSHFEYTNWAILKEIAGVPDLNSTADMRERMAFMMNVGGTEQAVAAGFGRYRFRTHAETWGWDSTDLQWETTFSFEGGPPTYVLRFPPEFDFAPLLAHLEARDFTRTEHPFGNATVSLYSHPLDLTAEWLSSTEIAILNTAYLPQENTLILASSTDTVLTALAELDAGHTLAARPDIQSVATSLGAAGAAMIVPLGCPALDMAPYLAQIDDMDSLRATLEALMDTDVSGIYTVMGVGYRVEANDTPVGVFVHHYPVAAQAYADLDARRAIAETGLSTVYDGVPYAELFRVRDAFVAEEITGANLNLVLEASERPPQLFINMVIQRDLMFSVCGP